MTYKASGDKYCEGPCECCSIGNRDRKSRRIAKKMQKRRERRSWEKERRQESKEI
jgi:hypothetical protein